MMDDILDAESCYHQQQEQRFSNPDSSRRLNARMTGSADVSTTPASFRRHNDDEPPPAEDDHDHNDGTIISYESFHPPLHEQSMMDEQHQHKLQPYPLPALPSFREGGVKASRLWNSLRYYAFTRPIRLRSLSEGCHGGGGSSSGGGGGEGQTNGILIALFVVIVSAALLIQQSSSSSSIGARWFKSANGLPPPLHVAFAGNSMLYYNDVPRLLSQLSAGQLTQQSCLHGDATFTSLLKTGNGMYHIWETGNARVDNSGSATVHDFGACTVRQLLLGYDETLDDRVMNGGNNNNNNENEYNTDADDFTTFNDGKNPCLLDDYYYTWLQQDMVDRYGLYNRTLVDPTSSADDAPDDDDTSNSDNNGRRPNPPPYDFVVLNDNTRSPARVDTRRASLAALNDTYLPILLQMDRAIPVFMATYGYSTPYRDMGGLGTVAVFTSLTHYGYQVYADALKPYLPKNRAPRVAPVGIAFLAVWEENFSLWEKLFGVDEIHASPLGTYLQSCVLYHTLYGRMPNPDVAIRGDMSSLWHDARRFQPGTHRTDNFPTLDEARYLYHVAYKVSNGYKPSSFMAFDHGEAAEYTPQDDLYRVDDLF